MRLKLWLDKEDRSIGWFARKIGVPDSTVRRIIAEQRSPTHQVMEKIIRETNGEVLPNDFFEIDHLVS